MILFIGIEREVQYYMKTNGIDPTETRLVSRLEQLRGYDPKNLPEVRCIGTWNKYEHCRIIYHEAIAYDYKIRIIM